MTRTSVYPAWSESPFGVSTAEDVAVAWRNMISKSLGMTLWGTLTFQSHCPWIHNCVGANNQRHFLVYVVALEAGMLFFIRLAVYRRCFISIFFFRIFTETSKTFKVFRNPKKHNAIFSPKAFADSYCVIPSLRLSPYGHVSN